MQRINIYIISIVCLLIALTVILLTKNIKSIKQYYVKLFNLHTKRLYKKNKKVTFNTNYNKIYL